MSVNINTGNFSNNLLSETIARAADGNISSQELQSLIQIAEEGGINADERALLTGLLDNNNVREIQSLDTCPVSITFDDSRFQQNRGLANDIISLVGAGADSRVIDNVKSMPPERRAELTQIYTNIHSQLDSATQTKFENLLNSGMLIRADSQGDTILENLNEILNGPHQSGVRPETLLRETINVLDNRRNVTQGPHGTCGAASFEYVLLDKDPAEFTKIISDLATSGRSRLQDGSTLTAPPNSLSFHRGDRTTANRAETRTDVDIIFQSAVMERVAVMRDFTTYNVERDNSDGEAVAGGDSASDPLLLNGLARSVTGDSYDLDTSILFDMGTFAEMRDAANRGEEPIALITVPGSLHYVTVNRVEDGRVFFQNTAVGGSQNREDSMTIDEFKSALQATITED